MTGGGESVRSNASGTVPDGLFRRLRRGTAPDEVARWLGVADAAVMARYQRVISSPVDVI